MLYLGRLLARAQHAQDVKAELDVAAEVGQVTAVEAAATVSGTSLAATIGQPVARQRPDPAHLGGAHRLSRSAEYGAGASLHFAEHQNPAVPGHDVDLARPAPPVALQHLPTGVEQVPHGDVLAVPSQRVLGVHRPPPSVRPRACGAGGAGRARST